MKKINSILEKVYSNDDLRRSVVPLFIGNPGLGKTVFIEQFAKEKGVKLVELITSQMSPFEISGIAMPDKDTQKMTYYNFDKLEDLKDGDILFFDELLNGNPIVLNACLTILEQRRFISGKPLPNIMIVAAANHQGMVPLTPQIKERFIWYNVNFDPIMWKKYMTEKYGITKTIGEKLVSLIQNEQFTSNNFYTPRSIDKAVNMIIHDVETPYKTSVKTILLETIKNSFDKAIPLTKDRNLEPGEIIPWLDLIRIKRNLFVSDNETVIDLFELPEKWYVKITRDNFVEIYEGYYKKKSIHWSISSGYGLSHLNDSNYWASSKGECKGFKEITFEQFKTHVLNK